MKTRWIFPLTALLMTSSTLHATPGVFEEEKSANLLQRFFELLDSDASGSLEPYEGAESILLLVEEGDLNGDGALDTSEIRQLLDEYAVAEEEEYELFLEDADRNGDGEVRIGELPKELRYAARRADANGDRIISIEEMPAVLIQNPRDTIALEADEEFEDLDLDGDGVLTERDLDEFEDVSDIWGADQDGDGKVTRDELRELFLQDEPSAFFDVEGTRAHMFGTIDGSTPGRLLRLVNEHPEVNTIVFEEVPGSLDDDANLRAAYTLKHHGLNTEIPAHGMIASGGTDLFLAGKERKVYLGAMLGVHSWGGGPVAANDLPRDSEEHEMYLEYYRDIGIPEDFYWYTLEVADAEDMHWMTPVEVALYSVATEVAVRDDGTFGLDALDIQGGNRGILQLPESVDDVLTDVFDRYTRVTAPNGGPIHILVQSKWSEDQIVRARKVLEHILTDAPGTEYGSDKVEIANAMADRRATLTLFNDVEALEAAAHGDLGDTGLRFQDLRANECPVEGSADYLEHRTRDAAFEEIFHFVHDYGIKPVIPGYDREISRLSRKAEKKGIWEPWPENEPENHGNEYIAALYDNYLDLWKVPPTVYEGEEIPEGEIPEGTSHFGAYGANNRDRLRDTDPKGLALVEKFMPPHLTYTPELPDNFTGTFYLCLDPDLVYTTKAAHLRSARLRGSNPSGLVGNDHDNQLFGNDADNHFEGGGGNDIVDGGAGIDTIVFRGAREDYDIRQTSDVIEITDHTADRDGTTRLTRVERAVFTDQEIEL